MTTGAIIYIDGHRELPAAAHCQRCGTANALKMVGDGRFACSNPARCEWNVKKKRRGRAI